MHAVTSQRYARVHHDELASRVLDLMAEHPARHLPLAYKDGEYGAERVPSGAYLGDRDMFLFLVDGNRALDHPTGRADAGLFRGFILRNSDVGAAALTLDLFLFRAVCAGLEHVAGVGASTQDARSFVPRRGEGAGAQGISCCRPTPSTSGRRRRRVRSWKEERFPDAAQARCDVRENQV